jgi:transposase
MGRNRQEEKVELVSSELFPPIPADTFKSARAVFGRSNFYLAVGDQANRLFSGLHLADTAGSTSSEERRLAMLHLITVFQFIETLPDLRALDALRERVDWKYALHLPLYFPFRDSASFCEFRRWLKEDRARVGNFQTLLVRLSQVTGQNGAPGLNLVADQVIACVCRTSRLEQIWDTMSQCLEALAIKRHDWLRVISLPHWYDRYRHFSRDVNLRAERLEQETFAQQVGADGFYLLEQISSGGPPELADLPEVKALQAVWSEQYEMAAGAVRWKKEACSGCSLLSKN